MTECIHVSMSIDDFRFITTYDPDRGNAANLHLSDESVDLVVTSPPYDEGEDEEVMQP